MASVTGSARRVIAAFVEKIEVNPDDKTGTVYLHAGLEKAIDAARL